MGGINKDGITVEVGKRLKKLREERGISMRSLARESGLSANALSMIERGLTSPSVSTLMKLSSAMEVPVTAFFRSEPQREKVVFVKAPSRARIAFNSGLWEGLGGELFSGRMETFMITLDAGARSGPQGMQHSGSEFVFCLRGLLEYEVNHQFYQLEAGDSLIFTAQNVHRWRNPGPQVCNAIIVISSFEEGDKPTEYHLASSSPNEKT